MSRRIYNELLQNAAGCLLWAAMTCCPWPAISGAEPPAGGDSSFDGDAAASQPQADALSTIGAATVDEMQRAQAGFAEGRLTEETETQQARIMQQLQRLSDLARQQSKPVAGSKSSSSSSGQAAPGANSGDGQGAAGRSSRAAESSERPRGVDDAESRPVTARDLATSVWGHLPARQRDRMQSRFSERFLPQYADLVRRYYEALATEGVGEEPSPQTKP